MYDTFGFPLDLTVLMCEEKGLGVDQAGYEAEMADAKLKAKEGGNATADATIEMAADEVDTLKTKMGVPPTDDAPKYVGLGGRRARAARLETVVRGIIDPKKTFLDSATDATPAGRRRHRGDQLLRRGGRAGGRHSARSPSAAGATLAVEDVKKVGPYVLHCGKVSGGALKLGDAATLTVDFARRAPIAKNHTSTHMLNYAIMKALGKACDQRGSLCDHEKLRFDFAHDKPLSEAELQAVQDGVNAQIAAGLDVQIQVTPLEAAKAINGLRAVFGEQYPDPVRVVSVGGPGVQPMVDAPASDDWAQFAIEFCGGTHLKNSKEAQKFALLAEEGLGRGVRRVLGVTAAKAEEAFAAAEALTAKTKAAAALSGKALVAEAAELAQALEKAVVPAADRKRITDELMALKKKVADAEKGAAKAVAEAAKAEGEALAASPPAAGVPIVKLLEAEADAKALELAVTAVTSKLPETPVLLLGAGKTAAALAVVPKALEGTLSAKDWVNEALQVCGGKGGGKPGRAQGAARDPAKAKEAEAAAKKFAAEKLSVEVS